MTEVFERVERCYESIRERIPFRPQVALVLGSGLGDYAREIQVEATVDYHEIAGFPVSTVSGHRGCFIFGYIGKVPAVIMQGRVHYYEGYSMEDVVLPIRLMRRMGAGILFLTNAAGGVNLDYQAGDFMIIRDQITSFVPSPLTGPNEDSVGPRFCDMSSVYGEKLRAVIRRAAGELGIRIQEGVYIQMTGPEYETPATVKMCRLLGADAVGMSTGCEAVAARHLGMEICGISCITNMAAGISGRELSHEEVGETAARVSRTFKKLVTRAVEGIASRRIDL